jgi:hypothetical protein
VRVRGGGRLAARASGLGPGPAGRGGGRVVRGGGGGAPGPPRGPPPPAPGGGAPPLRGVGEDGEADHGSCRTKGP